MSDDEKKKRAGVKTFLLRKLGSVRSRLQSERSKDILTFLMFVALSFLFWMMQSLGEDMNTVYRIPIKYTNIPDNTIITCELPTSVTVHLRDEGAVLMNYNLEGIPSFEVDFKQYANSRNAFILTSEEIKNLIKKNLRNTTNLTSMSIDTLAVYYTQAAGKKVKVRIEGSVTTVPQCIISGKIHSDVDSVQVYAPEYLLNTISYVETDSFVVKDIAQTWTQTVPLRKIEGVKIVPNEITLTVPVEELTSKSLSVPVSAVNVPRGMSLLTFPAVAKVDCMVPVSRFSQISAEDIAVAVDYKETRNAPEKLAIKITRTPGAAYYATVAPDSVEYILEQKH